MSGMAVVELLYFDDCPNWRSVRKTLDRVVAERSPAHEITLVEIENETAAVAHRFLGSPTVRVDGRDVEPGADERRDYGMQCRVYRTSGGLGGAPDEAWIRAALTRQP